MKKILLFLVFFVFSFSEEINSSFIKEKDYQFKMIKEVKPYLTPKKISGKFKGAQNKKLYYENFIIRNPKASIVLVHGFGESIEKFYELIYYFNQNGYSVYALEHRGHSRSDKFSEKSPTRSNFFCCSKAFLCSCCLISYFIQNFRDTFI